MRHEEDPKYIENNGVNRGKASEYYGIGGSAREAEIALVERDLKLAEETGYTGRILAVGIAYDRKTKEHTCEIEVLEN